jgi:hypothetical protein
MKSETLEQWLVGRSPDIPPAFLPHLLEGDGGSFGGPGQLEAAGVSRIALALKQPGRSRTAAFDLLAGDAFLTYACEALAREEDPGQGLNHLLQRLGGQLR